MVCRVDLVVSVARVVVSVVVGLLLLLLLDPPPSALPCFLLLHLHAQLRLTLRII